MSTLPFALHGGYLLLVAEKCGNESRGPGWGRMFKYSKIDRWMGELCTQEASGLKCAGQLIKLYIIQRPIYTCPLFCWINFCLWFFNRHGDWSKKPICKCNGWGRSTRPGGRSTRPGGVTTLTSTSPWRGRGSGPSPGRRSLKSLKDILQLMQSILFRNVSWVLWW